MARREEVVPAPALPSEGTLWPLCPSLGPGEQRGRLPRGEPAGPHPSPLSPEHRAWPLCLPQDTPDPGGCPVGVAGPPLGGSYPPPTATYTPNAVTPLLRYRPHPVPSAHLQQAQPTGGRLLKPMTPQGCSGI